MYETDSYIRVFFSNMVCYMFCTVYRTMLSSSTTEADHQIRKSSPAVCLHMRINNSIYMFEEIQDFSIILKEADYSFISACQLLYGS